MFIAFDPILFRPGSPEVQAALQTGLNEATLRRFFPDETTWLAQETYLMTIFEATAEDLEVAAQRVAGVKTPMGENFELGQATYEAYCRHREANDSATFPTWEELTPAVRSAWVAAGEAAAVFSQGPFVPRPQGQNWT